MVYGKLRIQACFVNLAWTVGRCVDEVAKLSGVVQSTTDTEMLRLFYGSNTGSIISPLDATLDSLIKDDNISLYNGMALALVRVKSNDIKEVDISKYNIGNN